MRREVVQESADMSVDQADDGNTDGCLRRRIDNGQERKGEEQTTD
jgi:hypothetical protein